MNIGRVVLKNSLWNILGYSYLLLISLISIPLLIQGLTLEGYARYLFVGAIASLAATLNLGLPTALVRSESDSQLSLGKRLSRFRTGLIATLILSIAVSVISCYTLVATHKLAVWSGDFGVLYACLTPLALLICTSALSSYLASVAEGRRDFAVANIRTFTVGTANTALSAAAALKTGSLAAILYVQVVGNLVAIILLTLYIASHYSLRAFFPKLSFQLLRGELRFGIPVFIGNLAPQLEYNLARLLSGGILASPDLAALGLAQSLVNKGTGMFNQVTSAFLPSAVSLSSTSKRRDLMRLVLQLTLAFVLSVLLALGAMPIWGQPFLTLWLRDQGLVSKVTPLVTAYLVYSTVLALTPAPAVALTALGKPSIPAATAWLHVILELILLVVLLPHLGSLGSPLASLIAVVAPTAILLVKTRANLR